MAGIGNSATNPVQDWRQPGVQGINAETLSRKTAPPYHATLEPPATSYVDTDTPLKSQQPALASRPTQNASLVDSRFHREGLVYSYSHGSRPSGIPQQAQAPQTSKYQPTNTNLFDYVTNLGWYICYPAASVMLGGLHNLGLSERVPQLVTRNTGGPGTDRTRMLGKPQYTKVQNVPRYSTLPQNYNTTSANS